MPRPPTIFIYRSVPSASALALAASLREAGLPAKKIRRHPTRLRDGDRMVGWGDCIQLARPVPTLNWREPVGKLSEMQTLNNAGVDTPRFATRSPQPASPNEVWVGRLYSHHSGNDLLHPPSHPGFWVLREQVVKEFRVHVWHGVSARVGMKVPRLDLSGPFEGVTPHPWIRSYPAGWILDYGEGARNIRQKHRDVAKAACSALNLDFGAVDVGEREDGSVLVFEVNRAPGLEGETLNKYRDKIARWARGDASDSEAQ